MPQKKILNTKSQSGHKAHEENKMKISLIFLRVRTRRICLCM